MHQVPHGAKDWFQQTAEGERVYNLPPDLAQFTVPPIRTGIRGTGAVEPMESKAYKDGRFSWIDVYPRGGRPMRITHQIFGTQGAWSRRPEPIQIRGAWSRTPDPIVLRGLGQGDEGMVGDDPCVGPGDSPIGPDCQDIFLSMVTMRVREPLLRVEALLPQLRQKLGLESDVVMGYQQLLVAAADLEARTDTATYGDMAALYTSLDTLALQVEELEGVALANLAQQEASEKTQNALIIGGAVLAAAVGGWYLWRRSKKRR
jgi:LPXTG-motif cell wall-anchored protein